MKSSTALKSFKQFLKGLSKENADYSRKSSNISASKNKISIGQEYLSLYQLITIYQIMQTSQSKEWEKRKRQAVRKAVSPTYPEISMDQKNYLVEVVRRLDEILDMCFPNMPRETFYETFRDVIIVP